MIQITAKHLKLIIAEVVNNIKQKKKKERVLQLLNVSAQLIIRGDNKIFKRESVSMVNRQKLLLQIQVINLAILASLKHLRRESRSL